MRGTIGNLVNDPQLLPFVVVSIAASAAIFFALEKVVKSEPLKRTVEYLISVAFILICAFWVSHVKGSGQIILDKGARAHPIARGASVKLVEVQSLKGWAEGPGTFELTVGKHRHGDHADNRALPDPPTIFGRILRQVGLESVRPETVAQMNQAQWEAFLAERDPATRRQIGSISFARLETYASDDRKESQTAFKNDPVYIRNKRGEVEAKICVDRVFNTNDRTSGEREAVVLSYGQAAECR